MPDIEQKDHRLMTDLPVLPYLEACKTWGAAVERQQKLGFGGERMPFSVMLDCLRVYEFERAKEGLTRDDIEAPHPSGHGQ
jgi:hypothetical protein